MNVGIIGCGLIGNKRAKALGPARLVACADAHFPRAEALAGLFSGCRAFADWNELLAQPDIELVIIATLHDSLAEITRAAILAGKHVLVEKPAARNPQELEPLVQLAAERGVLVRVGFNHRYHRAFVKARELFDTGSLGDLMFIRARYGHGGRVGYNTEWRADPVLSGGGELIDQGPHLIDLSRWFMGDLTHVDGVVQTCFWDMPVDDNAFMLLQNTQKKVAFLHVSCSEWKNMFCMEIYCKHAKLEISGLGGSYGLETLKFYRMRPEMGPPETTIWEYPTADDSWSRELLEFYEDIQFNRQPAAGLPEALSALYIVQKLYKESGYDHSA